MGCFNTNNQPFSLLWFWSTHNSITFWSSRPGWEDGPSSIGEMFLPCTTAANRLLMMVRKEVKHQIQHSGFWRHPNCLTFQNINTIFLEILGKEFSWPRKKSGVPCQSSRMCRKPFIPVPPFPDVQASLTSWGQKTTQQLRLAEFLGKHAKWHKWKRKQQRQRNHEKPWMEKSHDQRKFRWETSD